MKPDPSRSFSMTLQLEIPDTVARAIRLPAKNQRTQLILELALALYARGILSFGKARELASVGKAEFGILLGERNIARHYGDEELKDDLEYARSE
jgi:predicted HTH domain antitoxin